MGSTAKTTDTHNSSSTGTTTSSTGATAPTDLDPRGGLSGQKGDLHHTYWTDSAHSGLAAGTKNTIDYKTYPTLADCKASKAKTCGKAGYAGVAPGTFGTETENTWCVHWGSTEVKDKTTGKMVTVPHSKCLKWPK